MSIHADTLEVEVTYPAAAKPFADEHASPSETVGHFKARVLTGFGLVEGQLPDGTIATYTLWHGKTKLEDPNQTLGSIVPGHERELKLKLSQHLTQG
jgi:hypothetical protein